MPRRILPIFMALFLENAWSLAQVPPEERIPITDPIRLEALGFPRDAKNVFLWSKADLNGSRGLEAEGRRPLEPETWGTHAGYTAVPGSALQLYDHLWSNARYDTYSGFFLMTSGQSFPAAGYAQVQIPDGAELKQIRWWLVDESADEDSTFWLRETCQSVGFDDPFTIVLAQGQTFGTVGNWFSFNTLDGHHVYNKDCAYQIAIAFGNPSVSAALRFHKATVSWVRQVSRAPATATFTDVPTSHPYYRHIEALFDSGITGGCKASPLMYCPDRSITRGEMAVFLAKALGLQWP